MPKSGDSELAETKHGASRHDYQGDPRWSLMTLEEIEETYWATVAPDLRADGFVAESHRPTYQWLREHDYRNLIYVLDEYHDLTFVEF